MKLICQFKIDIEKDENPWFQAAECRMKNLKRIKPAVVDTAGLGEGEVGLIVTGSTAKMIDLTKGKNVDGTLVVKVERIDLKDSGKS